MNLTEDIYTGLYQETVDHMEMLNKLSFPPVIVNDLEVDTIEGKQKLSSLLYTRYDGDSINIVPSCDCGDIVGAKRLHQLCTNCNTICEYETDKKLEALLWIKTPHGIDALISPVAWIILFKCFSSAGFSLLDWLTDATYEPTPRVFEKNRKLIERYQSYGIPRGLNSFYQNFDRIIELVYLCRLAKDFGPNRDDTREWIKQNRHTIFTKFLPIPSKISFVVENSGNSTYIDDNITQAFDAVHAIISAEKNSHRSSLWKTESKVVYAVKTLANYYLSFASDTLGAKPGIFRKQVFGGSLSFTGRAVISSNTGVHQYDELHLPWSLSLQILKLHITNKLLKAPYNYNPKQINDLLRDYALEYNPLLEKVMNELIAESPKGKIPCLFQRNPSLHRGAAQLLYITKVKTDPRDTTITFSTLAISAPNADFDGDEMNLLLILDLYTFERLSRLEPHLYALDLNRPHKVSGYLKLPGPIVSTLANWLYKGS